MFLGYLRIKPSKAACDTDAKTVHSCLSKSRWFAEFPSLEDDVRRQDAYITVQGHNKKCVIAYPASHTYPVPFQQNLQQVLYNVCLLDCLVVCALGGK